MADVAKCGSYCSDETLSLMTWVVDDAPERGNPYGIPIVSLRVECSNCGAKYLVFGGTIIRKSLADQTHQLKKKYNLEGLEMSSKYILDESGNPQPCNDLTSWAKIMGGDDRRVVGKDTFGDVVVSTVFLGLDHSFGVGEPILFETMVFGGDFDGEQERCSTREQAEEMHKRWCKKQAPDCK